MNDTQLSASAIGTNKKGKSFINNSTNLNNNHTHNEFDKTCMSFVEKNI